MNQTQWQAETHRQHNQSDAAVDERAFATALRHHQAGRFGAADAHYRRILANHPNHPPTLHNLGVLAQQMGDCDGQRFARELERTFRDMWQGKAFNNGDCPCP